MWGHIGWQWNGLKIPNHTSIGFLFTFSNKKDIFKNTIDMHISQIEITGFSYGVLNFVVSFKTQKIQWPKSI